MCLLAATLGVSASLAAPSAAPPPLTLHAAFAPYRLGRSTTLKLDLAIGPGDTLPPPVTRFELHLPANLELIGSGLGLSTCQPATLLTSGPMGCPAEARLGFGSAEIKVPVGAEPVSEAAHIEAEMGPPAGESVGVLLYVEAGTPVEAQLLFPGVLLGGANQNLSTAVPLIPSLPGAADISLVKMDLSLGPQGLTYYKRVRGRTVGYQPEGVALPPHCPRSGFHFMALVSFADGTTANAESTVACPSRR